MDLQLREKLALVTGSTAGIGYAIAEGLAREGASVIVNGRAAPRLKSAVEANTQIATSKVFRAISRVLKGAMR